MISQICKTYFIFCCSLFCALRTYLYSSGKTALTPSFLWSWIPWTGLVNVIMYSHWFKFAASSHRAASDRFNISMLITPRMVKYGGVKWKPLWVAPVLYFQKASYSSGGLGWAWAEVLAALAPASHPARTVIGRDSSLATSAHCLVAIT